jgi:hypothetical protein
MPPRKKPRRAPSRCFLLSLPIELRLQIYNWALVETSDVTVTVAEREHNTFDDSESVSTIEGLPGSYVPVIRNEYDAELLKVGMPTTLPPLGLDQLGVNASMDSGYGSFGSCDRTPSSGYNLRSAASQPAIPPLTSLSILLTNKQIHEEFSLHIKHPTASHSTLHVTYPYGIIVLQELYPALLRHCEKVCVSGYYDGDNSASSTSSSRPQAGGGNRSHTATQRGPAVPIVDRKTHKAATAALTRLTRTILSPDTHATLKSMEMRMFYPDETRYGTQISPTLRLLPFQLRAFLYFQLRCSTMRASCYLSSKTYHQYIG